MVKADQLGKDYVGKLYEDLLVKSAIDTHTTIKIISCIENLALGKKIEYAELFRNVNARLPGQAPKELVADFEKYWANSDRPSLTNILELRDSLERFESL